MVRREFATLFALLPLLTASFGGATASPQEDGVADAAERVVRDYSDAFSRSDTAAIARYFHMPFMGITPQRIIVLNTPAEVEASFGSLIRSLREHGYSHSTWTELRAKALGPVTAIASGSAVRHTNAGGEMQRIGATYILRETDDGWRIAVNAGHPPSDTIRL